jgi:hypothetical protein
MCADKHSGDLLPHFCGQCKMLKAITKAFGSILLILGLIAAYDALFHGKEDMLVPETLWFSVSFVWPLLLVAGGVILFLSITKAKKSASYRKILIAGLVMLGVPVGYGIVVGTGEAGGMLVTFLVIIAGLPGLFLTVTALVLMLGQITIFRQKHN